MQDPNYSNPGEDLLNDLSVNLERASTGKRFANYLIDLILFYAILAVLIFVVPTLQYLLTQGSFGGRYLFIYALFFLFYFLQEASFKGKTLGKLITGTRAVTEDGAIIDAKAAAIRTLCRLVPFEPFSAFGYPWHDRWSRTIVIDERRSTLG